MAEFVVLVLIGAISAATPLVLAGLGEVVLERAGAGWNLGIEGTLLAAALTAVLGSHAAGPWAGMSAGLLTGVLFGALYAAGTAAGIDVVITGISLTVLGTGLSGYLSQVVSPAGTGSLSAGVLPAITVPGLDRLPLVGAMVTGTSAATYLALALALITAWTLRATRFGLRLRAVGDDAVAAATRGIPVRRYRTAAAVIAGACAGLAGAALTLMGIGTFSPMMSGGRGFLVLAVVIVARRTPGGVLAAALLFGGLDSLALLAQTRNLGLPVELYQALPYVAAVALLVLRPPGRDRTGRRITTERIST